MPQNDKRRYLSRHPSSRRDEITSAGEFETGNAEMDGFTVRYRAPQPRRPNPDSSPDRMSYPGDRRSDSSLYSENYACDGLMTDDEARYSRFTAYDE
jgi:hypothetical protein